VVFRLSGNCFWFSIGQVMCVSSFW